MMIVSSNSLTISNVNDGTITHLAYSWSADGTDRFTTVYPGENLLLDSQTQTKDGAWFRKNNSWTPEQGTYLGSNIFRTNAPWSNAKYSYKDLLDRGVINTTDDFTFSNYFRVVGEDPAGMSYANIRFYSTATTKNSYTPLQLTSLKEGQWTRVVVPFKFNSAKFDPTNDYNNSIRLEMTATPKAAGARYEFVAPKLEKGSIATLYMSPLDDPEGAYPKFIGTYTDYTTEDSTDPSKYTWAKLRGEQGPKGDSGADGKPGKDGVGIKTTVITYAISTSGTTAPITSWTSSVPSLVKGQYLWTKTVWTYTDNSFETGYSVTYISKDGNNGSNGLAGKDGTGIKTTTITYAGSTSGTTAPTSGWTSTVPTVAAGSYLWTKTVWAYTDNTSETGYSVAMMGVKGDTGDRGLQGATTYTWIKYATDSSGSNISDSPTGMSYIGIAPNKTTSTESSIPTDYTWSLIKGDQGVPGKTGADGKTSYFHIAYANSSDGSIGFTTSPSTSESYNYMGTYSDYTSTSSQSYSSYTWVAMFDSTKKRNFTNQPTTPYAVGDTWTQSGATYFCTTARNSGAFTASDWTMQQLKITSLDSDTQTNLKNSVKTTGTYKGVTLNDSGLTATAGSTTVAMNSTDGFLINNNIGQVFHVDTNGNLTIQGNVNSSGTVSGVNFTGNNLNLNGTLAIGANGVLSANGGKTVINNSGLTIKDGGLSIEDSKNNQTTYVGSDGTFITNKGVFNGSVTATQLIVDGGANSDINLGGGKFHVDSGGNLTAKSATLVNGTINSATLNSATINSPDITVPFDYFDEKQIEFKGSMEFKDGMLKHVSTDVAGGMLKTVIRPTGYTLSLYHNQSDYTQNNPYINSAVYADQISFYNKNIKKSASFSPSGIGGDLNTNTDDFTSVGIDWADVQKYLPEMSQSGSKKFFNWFDMMSSVQSHPNLLKNSSFKDGFNNWDNNSGWFNYPNGLGVHQGNKVAMSHGNNSNLWLGQMVLNVLGNQKMTYSFWLFQEGDKNIDGGIDLRFENGDGSRTSNFKYTIESKLPNNEWVYIEILPVISPGWASRVYFAFFNRNSQSMLVAQPMLCYGDHVWPYQPT